ncbi:hypothetical protein K469DRAFT_377560 [Zopfia rhizophila CBS 207.26]|uniref:Uncharacterized protein n=1 Tax=Zopfia rhizophila CBS 207.26 TaxID=1314779 RepID=A0A6A6DD12_9PEZI|nr:hypothetical protein K469DRAFT_377560 [Zopfia rhizophila CBS 207.26]
MKLEWALLRANPNTIELPEDKPESFEVYPYWVYSKTLPAAESDRRHSDNKNNKFATIYVLGEL